MEEKVLYPPSLSLSPFLSSMNLRSLTCAFSHINVLKENSGIQDNLNQQKASNLVNSLILTYATSVNVWDNMASLQP